MAASPRKSRWLVLAAIAALWLDANAPKADVLFITTLGGVSKITPDGVVSDFVVETGDGPTGNHLNTPLGLTADSVGNLYVSSLNNNDIVRIAPDASTSIYGNYAGQLNQGLAMDRSNNLYIGKYTSNYILRVAADRTQGVIASLSNHPEAVAVDNSGNVYSSTLDNTVIKITPAGALSTLAAGLNGPDGLALDGEGNLYVAIVGDNAIRKITPDGTMSTFATGLNGPLGIAFDSAGNLFDINRNDGTISRITPDGIVSTYATGTGRALFVVAQAIPEPSVLAIISLAGVGLARRRRR